MRNKAELRVANHTGKRVRLGLAKVSKIAELDFREMRKLKKEGGRAQGLGGVRCDGRDEGGERRDGTTREHARRGERE